MRVPKKPSGKSSRSVVGLDIEPGHVAAVEVHQNGQLTVARSATASLGPGLVRDGEVTDVDELAAALKELWAAHKLPKRVRLGVANQRIVVRTVDLPPVTDRKELDAAVRFSAQDQIPMPLEQAVLEYQALGIVETPDGPRQRAVIVAARRDMIERHLAAARGAGLRPEGIDLSAFALIRALHLPGTEGPVLYLSVGGMTNLALAEGGTCLFTRVVPGGTELMAQELAERRGLTLDHSHGWLRHVGLIPELDHVVGDRDIVEESRSVLVEGARRVGDEVRNSLDFYRMQGAGPAVDQVVMTGPAAAIPGFAEALSGEIGVAVEARSIPLAEPDEGRDTSRLTVAAGLAVQEIAP
jgi:type IV pilus assembly protein PilM